MRPQNEYVYIYMIYDMYIYIGLYRIIYVCTLLDPEKTEGLFVNRTKFFGDTTLHPIKTRGHGPKVLQATSLLGSPNCVCMVGLTTALYIYSASPKKWKLVNPTNNSDDLHV
jgi:hypothetical protein